jgi:hypothetical protein
VEVEFVQGPKTKSADWVLVALPGGELRMLCKAWTSLAAEDSYQLLSQRPLLRLEALRELADWISSRPGRSRRSKAVGSQRSEKDHV